jgi:hypothetical protein
MLADKPAFVNSLEEHKYSQIQMQENVLRSKDILHICAFLGKRMVYRNNPET